MNRGKKCPVGNRRDPVKGENVMQGYYKDEQATSETFVNGRLRTGIWG